MDKFINKMLTEKQKQFLRIIDDFLRGLHEGRTRKQIIAHYHMQENGNLIKNPREAEGFDSDTKTQARSRAETVYGSEYLARVFPALCDLHGKLPPGKKSLPMSTPKPADYEGPWDELSAEEKDDIAREKVGWCAETKFRRDEWEKYKKQPEYAEKVKEYETKNAARGKKPAKPRSHHQFANNDTLLIPPSEEDLDSAIAELEALIESDDIRGDVDRSSWPDPITACEEAEAPITAFAEADENGDGVIDEAEFEKLQKKQHQKWCLNVWDDKGKESASNNAKYWLMREHPEEFGPTLAVKLTAPRWTEYKPIIKFGEIEYEDAPWYKALENDSKE